MDLPNLDLNLLRALDALLDERSVTRAAARLHVTQQTLSGALQRLRAHFDDPLLVRSGNQMRRTRLGEALCQPIRAALLNVKSALETQPSFDPRTVRRKIRIAMTDYVASVMLPSLVRALIAQSEHIVVEAHRFTSEGCRVLERGEVDMCITTSRFELWGNADPLHDLESRVLFTDEFVCAVDAEHRLAEAGMTLDDYAEAAHAAVSLAPGSMTIIDEGWQRAGLRLRRALIVNDFASQLFAIQGTPLVATTQRLLGETLGRSLGLVLLPAPVPFEPLVESLIWHRRDQHDVVHDYVRGLVVRCASPFVAPRAALRARSAA